MAIVAWTTCFVLTIVISLATARTKTDEQLKGLVYSLTPKPETAHEPWYKQPVTLGHRHPGGDGRVEHHFLVDNLQPKLN